MGNEAQAEQCYQQAIALDPLYSPAHGNFGVLRAKQGERREAEAHFRRALAIDADNSQVALNLAQMLLGEGRLAEGWSLYESRYSPRLPGPPMFIPQVSCPQWHGESLLGKSILVWSEQGLGDELQFCRYLPLLKGMGAVRVSFVCRPELKQLFASLAGVDVLVDLYDKTVDLAGHDYWSFTMSLAMCCGTELGNIPANVPYLSASIAKVAAWQVRTLSHDFKVGLVWRGNPQHHNDENRSLASLTVLAPLWTVLGVQFFSLQKGQGEAEAISPPAGLVLSHLGAELRDFADTAAAAAQMDLIISVDTSVAHLAGALGLPCWLMLPKHDPDWRWLLNRDDTPWYPTMRLWRQQVHGDWTAEVEGMRDALRMLVASRRSS
jgi:tetratricopeptide (TPR) repeat protein